MAVHSKLRHKQKHVSAVIRPARAMKCNGNPRFLKPTARSVAFMCSFPMFVEQRRKFRILEAECVRIIPQIFRKTEQFETGRHSCSLRAPLCGFYDVSWIALIFRPGANTGAMKCSLECRLRAFGWRTSRQTIRRLRKARPPRAHELERNTRSFARTPLTRHVR